MMQSFGGVPTTKYANIQAIKVSLGTWDEFKKELKDQSFWVLLLETKFPKEFQTKELFSRICKDLTM